MREPTQAEIKQVLDEVALRDQVEHLTHGICDALRWLDEEAELTGRPRFAQPGRAILRGLLNGTGHEGHRPDPHYTRKAR